MKNATVSVFTFKSRARILGNGGTCSWRVRPDKVREQEFAVCTRNAHDPNRPPEGPEAHRSAFMVGRIKDVVVSPDHASRWLITFSEYADVSVPGVSGAGQRNPVSYGSLDDFGIDPATLDWKPMPPIDPTTFRTEDDTEDEGDADDGEGAVEPGPAAPRVEPEPLRLTISQAKAGLALNFGVSQEAIDITIRG